MPLAPAPSAALQSSPEAPPSQTTPTRLTSIDAFRGWVMFLMMAEVLHLCQVSKGIPGNGFWKFLCIHQTHVEWIGCSLHDLIQPGFSFLVGVAVPFSIANRFAKGQLFPVMFAHAIWRALVLIFLGIFLRSIGKPQTYFTFEDTLTQIGLGYAFLFVLGFRSWREQWIALGLILVGTWAAFALYPLPGPDFRYSDVGVPNDWPHLMDGFAAHWNKNSNLAWAFDVWFLNLFPRESPFLFNRGGYATLSFIPTLGTMILGLLAGGVLRSGRSSLEKMRWLAIAGVASLALGTLLSWTGICPSVKRIWTPSWVLFSGGWCFLILAAFYGIIDVWQRRAWAFPLVVIGMNSIAAYCMSWLFEGFVLDSLRTHIGVERLKSFGVYETLVTGGAVLLIFWLILYWMHRRKLYLKI